MPTSNLLQIVSLVVGKHRRIDFQCVAVTTPVSGISFFGSVWLRWPHSAPTLESSLCYIRDLLVIWKNFSLITYGYEQLRKACFLKPRKPTNVCLKN